MAQGARQFEIQGTGFLKIDETYPAVTIGGKDVTADSLEGCESLETTGRIVETCTSIVVTVAQDALARIIHHTHGAWRLTHHARAQGDRGRASARMRRRGK